uniref:Fringe-like glycosyltransferase domain-containing protein n=1 Tax=Periophthalmus magnuspinnatus TaxID=409849 RepID=A0A3B4APN0_9GOBI
MFYEYDTFLRSGRKWLCHVDDDNYVNVVALLKLLSQYHHTEDVYLGRPSTGTPLQASYSTQGAAPQVGEVRFWFATGGAGFCLSRSLALRMQPWTSGGAFMNTSDMIRLPDDCTVGFIVEGLLGVALTHSPLFHSHLENLSTITDLPAQVLAATAKSCLLCSSDIYKQFRSVHCLLYPDTPWCPRPPTRKVP